jgi:LPXTG-site transpeptidase (sortase) family protein
VDLLKSLERLLLLGGAAALAWCAYVVTDAYQVQRLARQALESSRATRAPLSTGVTTTPPFPSEATSGLSERIAVPEESASARAPIAHRRPAAASRVVRVPLAELSIPRVGLSAIVLEGSDRYTLRVGLGHVAATALPGEAGNAVITGHRDSFFRPLRKIQVDDDIWIDTAGDRLHYRVSWFRVVSASELSVLEPTTDPTLTLVTCFPFRFIGPAPERFVVRAIRVAGR